MQRELIQLVEAQRRSVIEGIQGTEDQGIFWSNTFDMFFVKQQNHPPPPPLQTDADGTIVPAPHQHHSAPDDMLWFVKSEEADSAPLSPPVSPSPSSSSSSLAVSGELENANLERYFVRRRNVNELPPLSSTKINWEETVYLNIIQQLLSYQLTVAVCKKNAAGKVEVLNKVAKIVYASPFYRRMDVKADQIHHAYPSIFFTVDDFEEGSKELIVQEGERLGVQLSCLYARDKTDRAVIFKGSVSYEAMTQAIDDKSNWTSYFYQKRVQYITVSGPRGKGQAEIAISCDDRSSSGGLLQTWSLKKPKQQPKFRTFITFVSLHWENILTDILMRDQHPT